MSLLVSRMATIRAGGMPPEFAVLWVGSWLSSWAIAFPAVLIVGPDDAVACHTPFPTGKGLDCRNEWPFATTGRNARSADRRGFRCALPEGLLL